MLHTPGTNLRDLSQSVPVLELPGGRHSTQYAANDVDERTDVDQGAAQAGAVRTGGPSLNARRNGGVAPGAVVLSAMDIASRQHWVDYSRAKGLMFARN